VNRLRSVSVKYLLPDARHNLRRWNHLTDDWWKENAALQITNENLREKFTYSDYTAKMILIETIQQEADR